MGYDVRISPVPCNVMAVTLEKSEKLERSEKINFHAVADPRDIGTSSAL